MVEYSRKRKYVKHIYVELYQIHINYQLLLFKIKFYWKSIIDFSRFNQPETTALRF